MNTGPNQGFWNNKNSKTSFFLESVCESEGPKLHSLERKPGAQYKNGNQNVSEMKHILKVKMVSEKQVSDYLASCIRNGPIPAFLKEDVFISISFPKRV